MKIATTLLLSLAWQAVAVPVSSLNKFYPNAITFGAKTSPFATFTLNSQNSVVTLDYGYEVAGYPFFQIANFKGKIQIEARYTEDLGDIDKPYSDGPFPFGEGLTNTYRVETLEITSKLRLLTSGSVTFLTVGFKATVDLVDYNNLPGQFTSSDPTLNEVWKLGARAVGSACFSAGAYKPKWDISSSGAFVRGSRAGLSIKGNSITNYNLTFAANIKRGGLGWAMAYAVNSLSGGIQLNLVGDYPESTYANVDKTLLPGNSVVLAYGFSLVNQTSANSYYLDRFKVPFDVKEGQWYSISAVLSEGNYLAVSINGTGIFNVTLNSYYTGTSGAITTGSFGFGGWQDQAAYFKNVKIASNDGTVLYTNHMTDATVLAEFGVQSNDANVCLDGAKRDRLVWLGDFYHTVGILATSTSRKDYASGTLQKLLSWQLSTGQLPLYAALGYNGSASSSFAISAPFGTFYPLQDYHILGLLAFGCHMRYNNDVRLATKTWSQWKLAVDWLIGKIDISTGLVSLMITFFPDSDGLAVNAATVQALRELSQIATAVGDTTSASSWTTVADKLSFQIQSKFWQASLGYFSDTPQDATRFSIAGLSFIVTSGVASPSQAASCMDALDALKLSPGYKDSTSTPSSGVVSISPNTNGFLLSALMQSNRTTETRYLFENLWTAMIKTDATHTGASWEYVDTNLQPGLSSYTSLAHPWGGAPTYVLTEYVAGIRPTSFGYSTWVIAPAYAGFGLKSASAQVQTPFGPLKVQWTTTSGRLNAIVTAPKGTSGEFIINRALANDTKANTVVKINGGILPKLISLDL